MGANMSPTIKNSGRTVFGVKMGLSRARQPSCTAACVRMHILPCLQPLLPERRICTPSVSPARAQVVRPCRLLGGLLLFVFFGSSRAGSWLDIESVCSTCGVCAMADDSARVRESGGGREDRRRSQMEAEERGGGTFELGQAPSRFRDSRATVHAPYTSPRTVSEHGFGDPGSEHDVEHAGIRGSNGCIDHTTQRQSSLGCNDKIWSKTTQCVGAAACASWQVHMRTAKQQASRPTICANNVPVHETARTPVMIRMQ
jgi:hypothetical protein